MHAGLELILKDAASNAGLNEDLDTSLLAHLEAGHGLLRQVNSLKVYVLSWVHGL